LMMDMMGIYVYIAREAGGHARGRVRERG
jgi:hypothetical protein